MKHDPFYQQILAKLNQPLDPDVFEQCAVDLVRADWPALVPVRGGDDAGMDGAVGDGGGEPFPLVCTTGKDVIGNLSRSLTSYLADRGTRRQVIVVTSQHLTRTRRRNLERRAGEKGFTLLQIYDQAAVAYRLYRRPEWCRELLGLTGDPPALSAIPPGHRPRLELRLVGREADLVWLRQTPGDRAVVGVPGCGKTFLLERYVAEEEALFVVSDDRGAIAAALCAQALQRLIVDDAHVKADLLVSLQQLRQEIGAQFEIIACCWPGERDHVAEALQLPGRAVRELGLLTRDEIVQVVRAAGLGGPTPLVREIVDQAEGRPGLAVTLALLCLRGGVEEVALGTALSRSVRMTFERFVGRQATAILAVLAFGGTSGMRLETVAQHLGLPLADVQRGIAELAAGGVIAEVPLHGSLAVHPAGLREALVRDLFFTGPASLPWDGLLLQVPDLQATIGTLIGARGRNGQVPRQLLEQLLELVGALELWKEYASLGRTEATHVLTPHPELLLEVARAALHSVPEQVIPLLLQAAVDDERPLNPYPEHPLRQLEEWVQGPYPGTGEGLRRRRDLSRAVSAWLEAGGTREVAGKALAYALSPRFRTSGSDPGAGRRLILTQGTLTAGEIEGLQAIWADVAPILREQCDGDWSELLPGIEDLVFLQRCRPRAVAGDIQEAAERVARVILPDLARMAADRPGLLRRLQSLARAVQVELEEDIAADFATLYPLPCPEEERRQVNAVRVLAGTWADQDPGAGMERLRFIEREARERFCQQVCKQAQAATFPPSGSDHGCES